MTDRRRQPRLHALKGARIVFNGGNSTFDCLVRDLSDEGARLQVASTRKIPDAFDLLLANDTRPHRCRVVWRGIDAVGVAFEMRPDEIVRPPKP